MNRADHRVLTRVLGAGVALAGAVLALQITGAMAGWSGAPVASLAGSAVGHVDGTLVAASRTARHDALAARVDSDDPQDARWALAAQRYSGVWKRSVFTPSRVADPQRGQPVNDPLAGYTLSGVIVSGALRIALLTDPAGKGYSVVAGHTVPHTDWLLKDVTRREARFHADGQDLSLPMRHTPFAVGPAAMPGGPSAQTGALAESPAGVPPEDPASPAQRPVPALPPLPPGV